MTDTIELVEAPALEVIDRSKLERWSVCPAQAALVDSGRILNESAIAQAGNEVHSALSRTTSEYIDSHGAMGVGELCESVMAYVAGSRPDVQPDVIRAVRASAWSWAKYVHGVHHMNILRYDGGDGKRSGQLAVDIEHLKLRVTSEIDLLHATESPEVVAEVDYKSGHRLWTAADVSDSFQFCLHGWLILENYPDVQAVVVRIWNTRINSLTYRVEYKRENLHQYAARVQSAATAYRRYSSMPIDKVPTWPEVDKCSTCPAAYLCPASGHVRDIAEHPPAFVDQMVAIEAKLAAMQKLASAYVDSRGVDIVSEYGNCFGTQKPKASRKPTKGLYSVKVTEEESD